MKSLLPLLFCVFFYSNSSAQQSRFGIKGGLNLTSFDGKYANQTSINSGFHFGIYTNVEAGNRFAIQPELQFSTQGAEFEKDGDFDIELYYLNIPLIFKIYPTERLSIHFGPQFGVLVSSNVKFNGVELDNEEVFEPSDTGIALGLGYELEKVNFGVRYVAGLTELIFMEEKLGFPTDESTKLRSQNLQFYVGFSF